MRAPQTFTFCIPCPSGPHKPPLYVPQPAAPIPDVGRSTLDVGIGVLLAFGVLSCHFLTSWIIDSLGTCRTSGLCSYMVITQQVRKEPLSSSSGGEGRPPCLTRQKPLPRWRCSLSSSFKENICYLGRNLGPLGELRAFFSFPSKDMIPTCGHGVILERAAQG